ncbi:interferon-induced protein 44-like [Colossoma macropomum]|uniref:interferon-induced protein 44-like n=1 Tax=Colossoma macropomum TaxID=42526 RepID=UPI0018655E2A|nr:interferon-induced protein 44-like [Colossoma macropomum]
MALKPSPVVTITERLRCTIFELEEFMRVGGRAQSQEGEGTDSQTNSSYTGNNCELEQARCFAENAGKSSPSRSLWVSRVRQARQAPQAPQASHAPVAPPAPPVPAPPPALPEQFQFFGGLLPDSFTALHPLIYSQNIKGDTCPRGYWRLFKIHRLKKDGPGSYYPFVFSDIMGLEPGTSEGVHTDDIISILEGHVRNGYTFNPVCPLDKKKQYYNSNPGLKDKVHCLVSVLPADKISIISDEVIVKMKTVRERARNLDIPQVVIMPMVDTACPLVHEDLKKIYTSKKIKEKMQECSNRLGVPMNCIFPVKNYNEEVTNDLHLDVLILMALTNIIMFANDYVEEQIFADNE